MATADFTAEHIRNIFDFDPETGQLLWKTKLGSRTVLGQPAGCVSTVTGYRFVTLHGKTYPVHRLIWLHVHGKYPEHDLDHINGKKADNRLCNLRDVTSGINNENQRGPKPNTRSGYQGVDPNGNRWRARISVRRKFVCLGTFDTPEEAHAVFLEAKRRLHIGCTI